MKAKHVKAVKIVAMQDVESIRYSRKRDQFEVRFLYSLGYTASLFCERVHEYIPGIQVLCSGERRPGRPRNPYWWVTFKVVDVDAILAKVKEMGDAFDKTFEELYREAKAYMCY